MATTTIPGILQEGPLSTLSGKSILGMQAWVKQWFVLDDCLNLSYFRADKLKGQIVICSETTVRLSDSKPHAFELRTPFVTVHAQAKDDADRDQWIMALQKVIQGVSSEKRSEQFRRMRGKAQEMQKVKPTGFGTHVFAANNQQFEVDVRYEFKRVLGQGAYGTVVSVSDALTTTDVAIKKIKSVFDNVIDAKRILREIRIMKFLHHRNISNVIDLMRPPTESAEEFNDVYIVMALMDTDLHRVIYSQQKLTDQHIQFLLFQLLSAVHFMETAKVIHRDLKPPNILVNAACELKICDFGLARTMAEDMEKDPTLYVVTRWYRAPELLFGCNKYTSAIDLWSVGCILAELIGRKPLFPGDDYLEQIQLIVNVIGQPSQSDLESLKDQGDSEEGPAVRYLRDLPHKTKTPWKDVPQLAKATPLSLDLLDRLLTFNADERITAEQAIKHPYLAAYHSQKLERCDKSFTDTADLDESQEASKSAMRAAIVKEIDHFRTYTSS
jgi:mitogen-activated protein kinase 1/3